MLRMSSVNLPRRDFGALRPEIPKNPRSLVFLGERPAVEQFFDTALHDHAGRIVADEIGLMEPIVRG